MASTSEPVQEKVHAENNLRKEANYILNRYSRFGYSNQFRNECIRGTPYCWWNVFKLERDQVRRKYAK